MFDAPETQLLVLLQSILLGVAVGLYYDLLRAPRRYFNIKRGGVALLDGLFWIGVLFALFEFSLVCAPGQNRYFVLAGCGLGVVVYFCLLSPLVLGALTGVIKSLAWVCKKVWGLVCAVHALFAKLQLDKKLKEFIKKIAKTSSIFRAKGIK